MFQTIFPILVLSIFFALSEGEQFIIKGKQVRNKEKPFQAYLICYNGSATLGQVCGGTLINPRWVLTAAHCLQAVDRVLVKLGSTDVNEMPFEAESKRLFVHPRFNYETLENDIALIRLPFAAKGETIGILKMAPSCLDVKSLVGEEVSASGFGMTEGESLSDILLKTTLNVISQEECRNSMSRGTKIQVTANTICAKDKSQSGICSGDSGGPLTVTETEGQTVLVGVSSWSASSQCKISTQSGFASVAGFREWIDQTMNLRKKRRRKQMVN